MFRNIGKKIKILAKIQFWVMVIGFIFAGVFVFVNMEKMAEHSTGMVITAVFCAVAIIGIGIFVSWLAVMFTYAFGELVDAQQTCVEQNRKIIRLLTSLGGKDSDGTVSGDNVPKQKPDRKTTDTQRGDDFYSVT